jgi:hypothetical protein
MYSFYAAACAFRVKPIVCSLSLLGITLQGVGNKSAENLAKREGFEPRYPFGYTGFRDRSHQPLGHPSG